MRTAYLLACSVALTIDLAAPAAPAQAAPEPEPAPAALAPRPQSNFFGVSPLGFVGFLRSSLASFDFNYEHVFAGRHGVVLSGDFVHVHHASSHLQSHQWTFGGAAAYRFYFFGDARGLFAGAQVGYRRGWGHFEEPGRVTHVQLVNEQLRALAQVGYRFVAPMPSGGPTFTAVPRLGVGYGPYRVDRAPAADGHAHTDDLAQVEHAVRTSQDVLATGALVVDLELSLGVAF